MVEPVLIPVMIPELEPIIATEVMLLVHTPPDVPSVNGDELAPWHITGTENAEGCALTVTTDVVMQLAPVAYVIVAVPAEMPFTTPVVPTVAAASAVLHVPPAVASDNPIPDPAHTTIGPVIEDGSAVTVTVALATHPVPSV